MKLKYLISIVVLIALIGTVSATTTFYLSSANSDLNGGADFSKNLTTTTNSASTLQMSIVKAATETQYAWTQAGVLNNADWETNGFTIRLNVTAVSTSTDIHINVQVDRVFANGAVRESSATSTEQDITAAGLYTYSIASKDWAAGAASDRMRTRYIIRNSKTTAARTVDFSFNDINSYVITAVTIIPPPPVSAFSADYTTGCPPLSVTFTDASTNTPTNWDWYWYANETKSSDSQHPSTSFAAGTYNVRLWSSNAGGGDWENKTAYITTTAAAVSAFSGVPTSGGAPLSVTFTDASTGATDWDWYWYANETKSSDTQNPVNEFAIGIYDVRLWAVNCGGGDWENKTGYITASDTTPVAAFSANETSGSDSLDVKFTDTTSNTPTNWDWYWSADETKDSDEQHPETTFTTGVYSVRLYTSNSAGGDWENKTDYINITAGGVAPTAAFSADDTTPTTSQSVQFTDASTGVPTNWDWYWSDDEIKNSDLSDPTNTFSSAGTYSVRLYVSNAYGNDWENKTNYITSSPGGSAPVAAFHADKTAVSIDEVIQFLDDSTGTPTDWFWDFGELNTSILQSPTHFYGSGGLYTVSFQVTNPFGSDWENKTNYINVGVCDWGDCVDEGEMCVV